MMQGLKTERGEQAGRDLDRASLRSTMPASGPLQVSAAHTGAPTASPRLYLQPHPDSTSSLQPHPDSTSSLTLTLPPASSLTLTLPPASSLTLTTSSLQPHPDSTSSLTLTLPPASP
ncbi:unnamed protein product [Arctogadus glacialis]